jgi:hypothetical protein
VPIPHGIWAWGVPGVSDAFQNTPISDVRAFGGWPGLSLALLGDGRVVGWGTPTLGGYHLGTDRKGVSAGTAIASAPGTAGPGAGVQALDANGTVWRYDQTTDSFSPVYGPSGVTAIGSIGQIGYASVS